MTTKSRNVFISFQQLHPEKGDDKVREMIESFGCSWAKLAQGMYYMHGEFDAQYVGNKIWGTLNMDDKLVVVDSTNNDARWYNVKPEVSQFMMDNWHAE
jgi:hypothetical protein